MLFAVALLVLALDEPPPPPDVVEAVEAWTACLSEQLEQAGGEAPPEAIADAMLAECRPQQDRALATHDRWLDSSELSEREKASARRAMERSLPSVRSEIVRAIRDAQRAR